MLPIDFPFIVVFFLLLRDDGLLFLVKDTCVCNLLEDQIPF